MRFRSLRWLMLGLGTLALGVVSPGCGKQNDVKGGDNTNVFGNCEGTFRECLPDDGLECETNTAQNVNHCGECNSPCSSANGRASCVESECQIECDPGFADCNGRVDDGCEVDLRADAQNCGDCSNTCAAGGSCVNSECRCGSGELACDDQCTDVLANPLNCGACGNSCSGPHSTQVCTSGSCAVTCTDGFLNCDGKPDTGCEANPNSDPLNCGGCGRPCPSAGGTASCSAGQCSLTCSSGFHKCGEECLADDSVVACGAACEVCPTRANGTPKCIAGGCDIECDASFTECSDNCVNLDSDPLNCGECGHSCKAGSCVAGECQPYVIAEGLPAGDVRYISGYLYVASKRIQLSTGNVEDFPSIAGEVNGEPVWQEGDNAMTLVGGQPTIVTAVASPSEVLVADGANLWSFHRQGNMCGAHVRRFDVGSGWVMVISAQGPSPTFHPVLDIPAAILRVPGGGGCPNSQTGVWWMDANQLTQGGNQGVGTAEGGFAYFPGGTRYSLSTLAIDSGYNGKNPGAHYVNQIASVNGALIWGQTSPASNGFEVGGLYRYDIAADTSAELVPPNAVRGFTLSGFAHDADTVYWQYSAVGTVMGLVLP